MQSAIPLRQKTSLTMATTQAIGFATEYYTLWTIQTETTYVVDRLGRAFPSGTKTNYYYQKNISKDLDKVKMLYPELNIDESLKGQCRDFSKTSEEDLCPEIMKWGKYMGWDINELIEKDFQYVLWIVENRPYTSNGKYASELDVVVNHYKTQNEEREAYNNKRALQLKKLIEAGKYTFVAEKNLSIGDSRASLIAELSEDLTVGFIFESNQYSKQYYNGFEYGLPLVNGKAKRIKGKEVEVEFRTEFDENYVHAPESPFAWKLIVTNFKILK